MPIHIELTPNERESLARRFWTKVNKSGPVVRPELGPCWLWTGAQGRKGYGIIGVQGHTIQAPRIAYLLHTGTNAGDQAMHRCDNPPCVNPAHIESGNAFRNNHDMMTKGRAKLITGNVDRPMKLKASDIPTIRQLAKNGLSRVKIGKRYGVHFSTIDAIIWGLTWKHV